MTTIYYNGKDSWFETYCNVCMSFGMSMVMDHPTPPLLKGDSMLHATKAAALTNLFEAIHKGRQWDGEWFEEIDAFIDNALQYESVQEFAREHYPEHVNLTVI